MVYGVMLPATGLLATAEALGAIATRAEDAGFASVWVTDHIAIPLASGSRYPYNEDGRYPWDPAIPYLDALTTLTWVAAVTRRVRLGISVLILPMRHPLPVAKAIATLDHLSGGRVMLGVGAGWLEEEFTLLGHPFHDRGRRLVEGIRVLRACWSPDPVSFQGEFYRLLPFAMDPKPAQGAGLPVLAGGEGEAALRRVAQACDGWHPLGLTPEQYRERLVRLDGYVRRAGRRISDLLLTVRPGRMKRVTRDAAARYEDVGVGLVVCDLNYGQLTLAQALGEVERLAAELRL
jgi:probable F420-dependent oxidoreductase